MWDFFFQLISHFLTSLLMHSHGNVFKAIQPVLSNYNPTKSKHELRDDNPLQY